MSDDDIVDVLQTDDFRITFVWRGLCFRDESERQKFEAQLKNEDFIENKIILKKIEADMHINRKLALSASLESLGPKNFGKFL